MSGRLKVGTTEILGLDIDSLRFSLGTHVAPRGPAYFTHSDDLETTLDLLQSRGKLADQRCLRGLSELIMCAGAAPLFNRWTRFARKKPDVLHDPAFKQIGSVR